MRLVSTALAFGLFSGVSVDNITDTPILSRQTLFRASGAELSSHGKGMRTAKSESGEVVIAEKGFRLEIRRSLAAGRYALEVESSAPNRGADSFWLTVDGKRSSRPLALPVETMAQRSATVQVSESGDHVIQLTLRESSGAAIRSVQLSAITVRPPRPPMRAELQGRHPRLLFTAADLPGLRQRAQSPAGRRFFTPGAALRGEPRAFRPGKRNGGSFRTLGSRAFSHLIAPDPDKLKPILEWLEMATTYPHVGADLDAEYFMEGVALTYDWLYDQIPAGLRDHVRETIARQCRHVFELSLAGRQGGGLNFQQNHYWFANLSLALGAAAVYGEIPEAETWLAWAWDRLERILLTFSPEGSFHEGPSYWDFSMPTLYLYIDLYEGLTGLSIPAGDSGLRGQAQFRFHYLYPGLRETAAMEDAHAGKGPPAARLALWEAKRFHDPVAMGIAEAWARQPSWLFSDLLWLDESVKGRPPEETLPLARHYADVETVFARTSWAEDATYVGFVCRPLGGHRWAKLCQRYGLGGTGHNHPAQNHFVLFGRGQVLAADPGYTYEKRTRNHNTILVGGRGQFGDGQMWPSPTPGRAHITHFATRGDLTIMAGDATSAYPPELGLVRFQRCLALVGGDLVVVCDRLASREPKTYSWLLHHYGEIEGEGSRQTIVRGKVQLTLTALSPDGLQAATSVYRPQYIHPTRDLTPEHADIGLLEWTTAPVRETTILVVVQIGNAGATPSPASDVSDDTADAVRVENRVVAFPRSGDACALIRDADSGRVLLRGAPVSAAAPGTAQRGR